MPKNDLCCFDKHLSKKSFFSVLLISLFSLILIVSCAPQTTDEELEAELEKLSDEDLDAILKEGESEEAKALAGKPIAYAKISGGYQKLPQKFQQVETGKVARIAAQVKTTRVQSAQAPVYEFILDTKNWNIRQIRLYHRNLNVERKFEYYPSALQQIQEKDLTLYRLILRTAEKEYSVPFSTYQEFIVEDFGEKENHALKFGREVKEEITVQVPTDAILEGAVTFSIFNNKGEEEIKRTYTARSNKFIYESGLVYEFFKEREACNDLIEVIPGHNRAGEDRINLIFSGHGYGQSLAFVPHLPEFIDYSGGGYLADITETIEIDGVKTEIITPELIPGIFWEEPFKSNKQFINVWYLDEDLSLIAPAGIDEGDYFQTYCKEFAESYQFTGQCKLPNMFVVNLINEYCRGVAFFGGDSFVSFILKNKQGNYYPLSKEAKARSIRTVIHELGHSIGSLRDEYVEEELGDAHGFPNCASSAAEAASFGWGPASYPGCAYVQENIRPTETSIMKYQFPDADFEYVNECHLCWDIYKMTGNLNIGSACLENDIC